MAKNEKNAKVKEKTTASIEFSDIQGNDANGTFALKIVPEKLDMTEAKTSIEASIMYYSSSKIAHIEEQYLGEYEIKAIIHGEISFSTKSFLSAMKNGQTPMTELNNLMFKPISVEVDEINPTNVTKDSVGLEVIKSQIEKKLMNTNTEVFNNCAISIAVLQQNYEVENQ